MSKTIIITGCENNYMPLVEGLLDSIEEQARVNQIDIGLLDFGLSDEYRCKIAQRGVLVSTDGTLMHRFSPNYPIAILRP
jgi:hypothetical protein